MGSFFRRGILRLLLLPLQHEKFLAFTSLFESLPIAGSCGHWVQYPYCCFYGDQYSDADSLFSDIIWPDRDGRSTTIRAYGLDNIPEYINYQFTELITTQGQETALAYVCIAIVLVYFLRNIFRYLALYFMAPVRNGVIRDLRDEMF